MRDPISLSHLFHPSSRCKKERSSVGFPYFRTKASGIATEEECHKPPLTFQYSVCSFRQSDFPEPVCPYRKMILLGR